MLTVSADCPAVSAAIRRPDVVGVRLVRLGRGQREHLGRADRVPLGQERKRDHPPRLAPGGRPGDDVVGGPVADRAAQRHAGRLGPRAQRVELGAVVVVAADRDDVGAGRRAAPTARG